MLSLTEAIEARTPQPPVYTVPFDAPWAVPLVRYNGEYSTRIHFRHEDLRFFVY